MQKYDAIIPQMWSVHEAAIATNTKECYIRKLAKQGIIKYTLAGHKYLINAQSLCDYLNGGKGEIKQ